MVVLQSSILEMPNTQAVCNNERLHGGRSHHQIPCLRSPKPSQIIGALVGKAIYLRKGSSSACWERF